MAGTGHSGTALGRCPNSVPAGHDTPPPSVSFFAVPKKVFLRSLLRWVSKALATQEQGMFHPQEPYVKKLCVGHSVIPELGRRQTGRFLPFIGQPARAYLAITRLVSQKQGG